jgi:hypothetical protein
LNVILVYVEKWHHTVDRPSIDLAMQKENHRKESIAFLFLLLLLLLHDDDLLLRSLWTCLRMWDVGATNARSTHEGEMSENPFPPECRGCQISASKRYGNWTLEQLWAFIFNTWHRTAEMRFVLTATSGRTINRFHSSLHIFHNSIRGQR